MIDLARAVSAWRRRTTTDLWPSREDKSPREMFLFWQDGRPAKPQPENRSPDMPFRELIRITRSCIESYRQVRRWQPAYPLHGRGQAGTELTWELIAAQSGVQASRHNSRFLPASIQSRCTRACNSSPRRAVASRSLKCMRIASTQSLKRFFTLVTGKSSPW